MWDLRKDTEMIKVWVNWSGSELNKHLPITRCEHYFPDVEDPEVIFAAYNEHRLKWDDTLKVHEEIPEYTNKNTIIYHLVNTSIMNLACREFIDKRIHFRTRDFQPNSKYPDDIYLWVTSTPDEVQDLDANYCRSDSLLGYVRIGKCRDGRPGCYLHSIV